MKIDLSNINPEYKDCYEYKPYTYRQSFKTEQEALEFCNYIIGGGIVQKQGDLWHVWQINS